MIHFDTTHPSGSISPISSAQVTQSETAAEARRLVSAAERHPAGLGQLLARVERERGEASVHSEFFRGRDSAY